METLPLLTKQSLRSCFSPLGSELPESIRGGIPRNPWMKEKMGDAIVHIVLWENNELLALVANKKDEQHPDKKVGIGIPTEQVRDGETPFVTAVRAVNEELNLLKGFAINEELLSVRKDYRNVTHITFQGTLEEYTELPKVINDPAGEIEGAFLVNPFSAIRVETEKNGVRDFFKPAIGGKFVYPSHLGLVSLSINQN